MSNALQTSELSLDLREHEVCWILPTGATISAATIDLPGGALILGKLKGKLVCRSGSIIIGRGGEFCGSADAERIYVEGRIASGPAGETSTLRARRLISISENADGSADLVSQAFAIHTMSFAARFTTLDRDRDRG